MYKLIKIGTQANPQAREYICDTVEDIADLPDGAPFGSSVFVIETSETYMKNGSAEYVKITVPGGGGGAPDHGGVFEVDAVFSIDSTTGKETITTDKKAEELYNAVYAGMVVVILSETVKEGVHIDVTSVMSFEAQKLYIEGGTYYIFASRMMNESGEKLYFCDVVPADDTIVLTQI